MGPQDATPEAPPPASLRVLKVRPQFLALARARRVPAGSFLLQARDRGDDDPAIGVGFTCSKKVGNAVARNRAKRRLREAARAVLPEAGHPGWDYALIGRAEATAARPFPLLLDDLRRALAKVHR
ncbi:ribonuclease P protein component [Jannaschia seohaensis]|uniref:Ribonuclease P protein component n=1 Tax=Jannaschia seohaensis TaxID=475081 RepID=A0A2Y9ABM9_9RHOB|nr:ribonuclease P protein component [Jannaschia seohaensis]PWJ20936.1 ribonuclease P protein component [Jannaschia seohaensis]SSA41346.1 ribonuclease P protein component [Jannaschia seohaensis]